MNGRCRHPGEYRIDRAIFRIGHDVKTTMRTWWADGERIAECEANRCTWCGEWLPMGHSDETPERVAVEIRAAEIAALLDEQKTQEKRKRVALSRMTIGERIGWNKHWNEHPWMSPESRVQHAGYLARVIATHEDETP